MPFSKVDALKDSRHASELQMYLFTESWEENLFLERQTFFCI